MKKRILSMLLAVLMVVSLAPITVFAGGNPVSIDSTPCPSVQSAVNKAENGQTIQLNTTCTENVTIPEGKTVTIDLNGNTLKGTGTGRVITVESGANLTLTDSSAGKTGKITGGNANGNTADEKNGGGVYVSGTFTMNGGSITGNNATNYGAGVFVNSGATFTMTGDSVVSDNEGKQGAGVYSKGAFTMSGNSRITGNTGTLGGGVGIGDGTFTMSGSSNITYNTGTGVGGVYIYNSTFTMTGGSIDHNTGGSAGGVYTNVDITLGGTAKITDNVKGGTITDGVLAGGTASNVYLPNNKYITLGTEDNAPTEGMSVGVTTQTSPTGENSVVFTGNCVIYTDKYFFSDNLNYCVRDVRSNADTGRLELSGKYDLWVNDVQVTVDNKDDVLGEADEDAKTVTYDNTTKTLTLNGAKFAGGESVLNYKKGVRSSIDELTVVLKGHNEIGSYFGGSTDSADESKYSIGEGFDCGELLQFVGDGSLTIYDSQAGIRAGNVKFGTEDEPFAGKVTIIDCGYVESAEPEPPCAISAIDSVTINGGTFDLTSYTSNGIAAKNININGCTEIKVKGAVNGEGAHAVNANTSLTIGDTLEVINSTYTKNETKSLDPTDGNKNDGYVIIRPKAAPADSFNITNGTPESDKETNHGYISIDKTTASAGETVTITVDPAEGYQLKANSLNVLPIECAKCGAALTSAKCDQCYEENSSLELNLNQNGTYSFTMPAYAVTVKAEFVSVTAYHLQTKTVDVGGLMGRQGLIEGDKCSETVGRTIIALSQGALESIDEKLVIVGGDGNTEFSVDIDCAYTYFYNGKDRINAKDITIDGQGTKAAAFIIIDNDGKAGAITGYGYYRLYNGSAESEDNFLFDVLFTAPEK